MIKNLIILCFCFFIFSANSIAGNFQLFVNSEKLISAIQRVENPRGDPYAVGDRHLINRAYGLLQIRQPFLDDVNNIAGSKVFDRWGKDRLTIDDMIDWEKAVWAFMVYHDHYGRAYKRRTGRVPTAEVYARIHNGGPNGWRRESTIRYAQKVRQYIN